MSFERVTGLFRELGLRVGVLYAADQMLSRIWRGFRLFAYDFVAQPVPENPLLPATHAQWVRFSEVRPGAPELDLMPPAADVRQARFDQGARCIVVYQKNRFVGYAWFSFACHAEDEIRCDYVLEEPEQSAFDFDVYVFPPYRMGRAFAAVWHAANSFLAAGGVRHTFSRISAINLASSRAHARMGARLIGRCVCLRAGPLECLLSSGSGGRRMSLTWQRRPKISLRG